MAVVQLTTKRSFDGVGLRSSVTIFFIFFKTGRRFQTGQCFWTQRSSCLDGPPARYFFEAQLHALRRRAPKREAAHRTPTPQGMFVAPVAANAFVRACTRACVRVRVRARMEVGGSNVEDVWRLCSYGHI